MGPLTVLVGYFDLSPGQGPTAREPLAVGDNPVFQILFAKFETYLSEIKILDHFLCTSNPAEEIKRNRVKPHEFSKGELIEMPIVFGKNQGVADIVAIQAVKYNLRMKRYAVLLQSPRILLRTPTRNTEINDFALRKFC